MKQCLITISTCFICQITVQQVTQFETLQKQQHVQPLSKKNNKTTI